MFQKLLGKALNTGEMGRKSSGMNEGSPVHTRPCSTVTVDGQERSARVWTGKDTEWHPQPAFAHISYFVICARKSTSGFCSKPISHHSAKLLPFQFKPYIFKSAFRSPGKWHLLKKINKTSITKKILSLKGKNADSSVYCSQLPSHRSAQIFPNF